MLLHVGQLLGQRDLLLGEGVALGGQFCDALCGLFRLGKFELEIGSFALRCGAQVD